MLEIDKVFGGAHENQSSDSGVSSRMLSSFLSWLNDRDTSSKAASRTFVMVTMNRTAGIPPELLRPGRFDKVWYTDLPDPDERVEIIRIHLKKRGIEPNKYGKSLRQLANRTEGFSGAEIEEVVRTSRCNAYDARMTAWEALGDESSPPTVDDVIPTIDELVTACGEIRPLSVLAEDEIKKIREFCQSRASSVNGTPAEKPLRASRNIKPTDVGDGSSSLN
jgi:SpoVK/Ycf46/Vps4 family AAA+-type ATPase